MTLNVNSKIRHAPSKLEGILHKAEDGHGLLPDEAQQILESRSETIWQRVYEIARHLTESLFHKKIYFFSPLYFSNRCANDCLYCGFRSKNESIQRQVLTPQQVAQEARFLWNQGHRTILFVGGEHPTYSGSKRIAAYIEEFWQQGLNFCILLETGTLEKQDFAYLRDLGLKRYVVYQETYDHAIYDRMHRRGPKKDYWRRYQTVEMAMESGFRHVGMGILLGLAPYEQDLIALYRHVLSLQARTGRLPATLSFPRLRPAAGVHFESDSVYPVNDDDFHKIVALTRLTFPEVGVVLTTRESKTFRTEILQAATGITHMSAGVTTRPGGYTLYPSPQKDTSVKVGMHGEGMPETIFSNAAPAGAWCGISRSETGEQFEVSDERPLHQVTQEITGMGYRPVYHWDQSE